MRGLFCADLHARPDRPRCRTDGGKLISEAAAKRAWCKAQSATIAEIVAIANKKKVPLGIIGDIFNTGHVPEELITMLLGYCLKVEKGTAILSGNHDLIGHNFKNAKKSAIGILLAAKSLFSIDIGQLGCYAHFGTEIVNSEAEPDVLFLHTPVFESEKEIPPSMQAITAKDLLKEFPDKKWIITGDMHKGFHYEKNGRHVINCGCINKQRSVEKDYKPSVWFIDTTKGIVKRIYLTEDVSLIDDSYLLTEKERNNSLTAFAEAVTKGKKSKISLSFDDNVENAIEENRESLDDAVIEMVHFLMNATAIDDK